MSVPHVSLLQALNKILIPGNPNPSTRWRFATKGVSGVDGERIKRKRPSNPFLPVWIVFGPVNSGFRTFSGEVRYERAGAGLA